MTGVHDDNAQHAGAASDGAALPMVDPTSVEFWQQFFMRNHPGGGSCDCVCVGDDREYERLSVLVSVFVYPVDVNTDTSLFDSVRVILPPASTADAKSQIIAHVLQVAGQHRAQAISPSEIAALEARIVIETVANLEAESVLDALRRLGPKSVAIIVDAARYSSREDLAPAPAGRPPWPEDLWVRHLHALVRSACGIAIPGDSYILVDAGESSPLDVDNLDLLKSIDDSAFYGAGPVADERLISRQSALMTAQSHIGQGLVGEAFAAIDNLDGESPDQCLLLKVQLLKAAGRAAEAFAVITPALERLRGRLTGESLVALAGIAADTAHPALAEQLLNEALGSLQREESLGAALAIASRLGAFDAEAELERRLLTAFPRSPALLSRRIATALNDRDYPAIERLVDCAPIPGFPVALLEFYAIVARALGDREPDYDALLLRLGERVPKYRERAALLAARDARARGFLFKAVALALGVDAHGPASGEAAEIAVSAIEELLIGVGANNRATMLRETEVFIEQLIALVSNDPSASATRHALTRLLSVETSGTDGLAFLAKLNLSLATVSGEAPSALPEAHYPFTDTELFWTFLRDSIEYFGPRSPIIIGKGARLPKVSDDVRS